MKLFDESFKVNSEIGQVQSMSAHGDVDDLLQFISNQSAEKVKGIFLVHGEPAVQKTFAEKILLKGFKRIEYPSMHKSCELSLKVKEKESAFLCGRNK